MQEKNNASLVMGILSIILAFVFPLLGPILGIVGLVLANSHEKQSELVYKTEKILNIVGIVISVINWIAALVMIFG